MLKRILAAFIAVFLVAPVWAEADDISRLYTFTAGTTIQSSQMNAEFNQLINTLNDKAGRGVDQTLTGDNTFTGSVIMSDTLSVSGSATFSASTNPLKSNSLGETTALNGVSVDGVLLKDDFINIARSASTVSSVNTGTDVVTMTAAHGLTSGDSVQFKTTGTLPTGLSTSTTYYVGGGASFTTTAFKVYSDSGLTTLIDITGAGSGTHTIDADPATLTDGDMWYNATSDEFKGRANGSTVTFVTAASVGDLPAGYRGGKHIEYVSTTQVKIPSESYYRDDSNSCNLSVSSDITIDITTSTGAAVTNALMNGLTESSDQFYYIWVIGHSDCSNPAGLLTTSSSTIATFPTSYSTKRLVGVVLNDSSSNFTPFFVTGDMQHPEYHYTVYTTYYDGSTYTDGVHNVLSGGSAATYTDVSLGAYQPPISEIVLIRPYVRIGHFFLRSDGSSSDEYVVTETNGSKSFHPMKIKTTSQAIEYKKIGGTTNGFYLDVNGFVITEWN